MSSEAVFPPGLLPGLQGQFSAEGLAVSEAQSQAAFAGVQRVLGWLAAGARSMVL